MSKLCRIISLMLVAVMLLSFSSCKSEEKKAEGSNGGSETPKSETELSLPYSREDGVNPFTANSLMNSTIMPLLYSGLFTLSESYEATPCIAASYKSENNTLVVTLSDSAKFSDGKAVRADDVIYSFNLAKQSVLYGTSLSGIESVTGANSSTVVFTTPVKNMYAASCLTFPIVKQNTAGDGATPIGAGPYVYATTADGGELTQNRYYSSAKYKMERIVLENISDTQTLMHNLVIGNVDAVFDDLSSGESQRINASSIQIDMNNLLFLGINHGGALSDPDLCKCLSNILDRDTLVSSGLEGYGTKTSLPFNPTWYGAKGVKASKFDKDDDEAYVGQKLSGRTLVILVNSDNNFKVKLADELSSQLGKLGVKTRISSVAFEAFKSSVESGSYDIYIGEYKLSGDMNFSQLIPDEETRAQYYEMLAGNITAKDFMNTFNASMPFIPIAYRNGVLAYSRSIDTKVSATPNYVFSNLTEWTV